MRPSTSPTTSWTLASLGTSGSRRLWMIASGQPSRSVQRSATRTRPASGETTVACGRRPSLDVLGEQRQREEVVDRTVEEALDLGGVQVDGHQPVGARGLEQVGDEPGRDRLTAAVLLVLAGVAVERHDHGDPLGRRPLERVDHEQLLHDPLVDRRGVALQHEGVAAAHRLLEAHEDLAVGEVERLVVDGSTPRPLATCCASSGCARPAKSTSRLAGLVMPVTAAAPRRPASPGPLLSCSCAVARRRGRACRRRSRRACARPSPRRCAAARGPRPARPAERRR